MNALVIGVSAYDTIIKINQMPVLKEDVSIWAEDVYQTVGGTGAGKALALNALGVNTRLVTDLAYDDAGKKIIDFFNQQALFYKILPSNQTTTHTNIMHDQGERMSIFTSMSTNVETVNIDKDIDKADIVFLNINDYCRDYIPSIKKYQKPIIVDIHDYEPGNPYHQEFIQAADILFVSGVNLDDQESFLRNHIIDKEMVVITNGKDGSIAINSNNKIYKEKAYKGFDYVDSNGAGDTFSIAFTYAYYRHHSIDVALKFSSVAAGMACASKDIFHPDASIYNIEKIIKNHN